MRRLKLLVLVTAMALVPVLPALFSPPAYADRPECPRGLERQGNRCLAPGSGQVTGAQPQHGEHGR